MAASLMASSRRLPRCTIALPGPRVWPWHFTKRYKIRAKAKPAKNSGQVITAQKWSRLMWVYESMLCV